MGIPFIDKAKWRWIGGTTSVLALVLGYAQDLSFIVKDVPVYFGQIVSWPHWQVTLNVLLPICIVVIGLFQIWTAFTLRKTKIELAEAKRELVEMKQQLERLSKVEVLAKESALLISWKKKKQYLTDEFDISETLWKLAERDLKDDMKPDSLGRDSNTTQWRGKIDDLQRKVRTAIGKHLDMLACPNYLRNSDTPVDGENGIKRPENLKEYRRYYDQHRTATSCMKQVFDYCDEQIRECENKLCGEVTRI